MRRFIFVLLGVGVLILAGCSTSGPSTNDPAAQGGEAAVGTAPDGDAIGEEEGRAGNDEVAEEANLTQERLDAAAAADAAGTFGTALPVTNQAAAGWSGEQLLNPNTDDWEPAVAADPQDPYVYLTTTRYGTDKTCAKHCPSPFIALTISKDGGT
ncbi:MAG TPA: hypothetical protein VMT27_04255, partial [Actinomycetes bacterium]|nr:hypothetical protein [Actinomycetes bacterium]